MKCATCKFYVKGKCRRYPPVVVAAYEAEYPSVHSIWWCGEYKEAVTYVVRKEEG